MARCSGLAAWILDALDAPPRSALAPLDLFRRDDERLHADGICPFARLCRRPLWPPWPSQRGRQRGTGARSNESQTNKMEAPMEIKRDSRRHDHAIKGWRLGIGGRLPAK